MELAHNNRIFFDATSHSYLLDGEVLLMGVTELMAKHGLSADYSGIKKEVLDHAAELGTELHKELQDYENGVTIFATELIDEYKKLGLKFVESEYPVSDYEQVASAIDMVYEGSKPNTVILVDIKATEKYHRRSLEWQLGIYRNFFEAQNPGIEVEGTYCLHLDKKTRRIRGFYPVDAVSDDEVAALLHAEKEGLQYIDENAVPDAALVLEEDELQTYVAQAEKVAELKAAIKEIEAGLKGYDERLLAYMMENGIEKLSANGGTFSLKKPYTQIRVDAAALKNKFPAIFSKVSKEIECRGSITFKGNEK